jgi:hypothetical protein
MSNPFPPSEESLDQLRRPGWSCGEFGFAGPAGRYVHQVDGYNGENKLRAPGATPAEAWHQAVQATTAVGMLADWPRPESVSLTERPERCPHAER